MNHITMKTERHYSKNEVITFYAISGLIWIYIWLRAIYSPINHDEAVTFFAYIQTGRFIPPDTFIDANNHFLNSFLTHISYHLFGSSMLAIRLPNILAAIFYFIYIFKIGGFISDRITRWAFIAAMCLPHFIIEFFAYCRGYGLSIAFFTGSVFFLMKYLNNNLRKHAFLSLVLSALAVTANLTLINSFLLIFCYLFMITLLRRKITSRLKMYMTLLTSCLIFFPLFILLARYLLQLNAKGLLYYGSGEGFYSVTIRSLSKVLFQLHPGFLSACITVIFFTGTFLLVKSILNKKERKKFSASDFIFPVLLTGNLAATFCLALFLKVNYPEDRIALYYYFLFAAYIFFIADMEFIRNKIYRTVMFVPFLLIIFQSFLLIGYKYTSYSVEYGIPAEFYDYLIAESGKKEFPSTVEAYQMHRTAWAYNNFRNGNKLNLLSYNNFPSADAEYEIADEKSFPECKKYYETVLLDKTSGLMLMKRKVNPDLRFIAKNDSISMLEISQEAYYNFIKIDTDSIIGKSLYITIDMEIYGKTVPFESFISVILCDSLDQPIKEETIELNLLMPDWTQPSILKKVLLVNEIPANSDYIAIFFCNKRNARFNISSGEIYIYSFDPPLKKNY